MSWSFAAIGTAAAVLKELDRQNAGLHDQSKDEWDAAKPGLAALVGSNTGVVEVNASGHASFSGGTKQTGQCQVTIRPIYGFVS